MAQVSEVFGSMEARFQRRLVIAIAHDIGILHRQKGMPPLYRTPAPRIALLAADTAGVEISPTDAARWETAALIAYRGAYDSPPHESFKHAAIPAPSRARRARGKKSHALPSTL
jgi:hypothetical protein